jgi:phosphoribosylaminoimidazolecarboxamide formyltransferase/IMP cyclohydrolase
MAINFVEQIDDAVRIQHVLVSVSDKAGLEAFIPELLRINPSLTLYSTGGTFQALQKCLGADLAGKHLVQVSDYTGQPEMQGGLVKTLDFKIYLGLLSETYNPAHAADLKRVKGVAIDMVIVDLYPFAQTIAKSGVTSEQARANIDIGGPCMVRAAAKNFLRVASVTNPADYPAIVAELQAAGGKLSLKTRFDLARKAFAHTAAYDTAIAAYLAKCPFAAVQKTYRIMT